ncbi:isochorismatase [Bacillus infantis NRRL B-14911]|uniref:Isochorismatase n=2 Tax=Bacillaceae TaxID=186817 RepID=U5L6B3_9BACI|nr:isochorismatase [Bacillus infantis NRRL B-14911]
MKKMDSPPALLVLDVQKGFDDPYWGKRNNPAAEQIIGQLQDEWRKRGWKIIYSQHLSVQPSSPLYRDNPEGVSFKDANAPLPDEKVFQKEVNSAFIGTSLESYLRGENIQDVCITGLSTQHCVSTTARMAGNLGFTTYLVSDACAAFEAKGIGGTVYSPEQVHEIELAMLNKEFAQVVTAGELAGLLV